jgi:hypothetical protein
MDAPADKGIGIVNRSSADKPPAICGSLDD